MIRSLATLLLAGCSFAFVPHAPSTQVLDPREPVHCGMHIWPVLDGALALTAASFAVGGLVAIAEAAAHHESATPGIVVIGVSIPLSLVTGGSAIWGEHQIDRCEGT